MLIHCLILLEFKKNEKDRADGSVTVFDRMIALCDNNGENFGNKLLDYQNIDIDELMCYMNIALCGTSNIRFKEKMFYEKLSNAITVSEEAFALLAFENSYKRWMFMVKSELNRSSESIDDDDDDSEGNEDDNLEENVTAEAGNKTPPVVYQTNIIRKKDKVSTAGKWTDKGYERYNELLSLVRESRDSEWRKDFEDELQKKYIERADGKLKAYKKRMKVMDAMLKPKKAKIVPKNMFDASAL